MARTRKHEEMRILREAKKLTLLLKGFVPASGGVDTGARAGYRFQLPTILGPLWVAVHDTEICPSVSLFCRFEDPDRAAAHFGVTGTNQGRLNPYSGKWNFHLSREGRMLDAEDIWREFLREVEPLLPARPGKEAAP